MASTSSSIHVVPAEQGTGLVSPLEVIAGDDVAPHIAKDFPQAGRNIELGHGLRQVGHNIVALHAGTLRHRASSNFYIEDAARKNYFPQVGDQVVGVIEDRTSDAYKVNISSGAPALLSRLAFEGATKRNKPELKRGDVVYCRVADTDRDVDTELTCLSATGVKKDWASGEAVYGPLVTGLVVRVPPAYALKLLHPDSSVLNALGRRLAFEIAVGMNGAVWLKAAVPAEAVVLRNALLNAQGMSSAAETEAMVDLLATRFRRQSSSAD